MLVHVTCIVHTCVLLELSINIRTVLVDERNVTIWVPITKWWIQGCRTEHYGGRNVKYPPPPKVTRYLFEISNLTVWITFVSTLCRRGFGHFRKITQLFIFRKKKCVLFKRLTSLSGPNPITYTIFRNVSCFPKTGKY